MNCVSCGAPLLNGAKFCTRCGTRQSQTIEQKPVLSVKKEDNSSQNSSKNSSKDSSKNSSKNSSKDSSKNSNNQNKNF